MSAFSIRSSTSNTLKSTSSFSELHRRTSSMSRSLWTSCPLLKTRSMSHFFNDARQVIYVQIQTSTILKSSCRLSTFRSKRRQSSDLCVSSTFRSKRRRSPNRRVNVVYDHVTIHDPNVHKLRHR